MLTLGDVLKAFFGGWKIILITVLAVTLLTGILNFYFIPKTYQAETEISVRLNSKIRTDSGELDIGSIFSDDFSRLISDESIALRTINLMKLETNTDDLIETLSFVVTGKNIRNVDGQMTFEIHMTGNSKTELVEILDKYTNEYVTHAKYYILNGIILDAVSKNLMDTLTYSAELSKSNRKLTMLDEIINNTPKFITAKEEIGGSKDIKITEILNPEYEQITKQRADLNTRIAEINAILEINSQLNVSNNKDLSLVNDLLKSSDSIAEEKPDLSFLSLLDTSIIVTETAYLLETPIAPQKVRNTAAAFLVSLLFAGVNVTLFRLKSNFKN